MTWSGYSEKGQGSQERGPGTFALQMPGGIVKAAPRPEANIGEVRMGVRGGEVRDTSRSYADYRAPNLQQIKPIQALPDVIAKNDPTADFLGKVAGAQFGQMVKKAQEEAFVRGAAKAASGEAMVEIANSQPWYQSIFGDTAVVEGARAYTIKAGVARWTAEHINQMDKLAERSPDEVPAYLTQSMQQYMTGDAATDQQLQAELLAQVPTLVKEHTKQHYALWQKRADSAASEAITNSLALFEQYSNGTIDVDPQGAANIMAGIEQSFALQPGMDPEAHYNRVSKAIMGAAATGQFKTISALGGLGYLDKLSAEDQVELNTRLRKAAPAKLREATQAMSGKLFELFRNPPATEQDLMAQIDALNMEAEAVTGVPQEYGTLLDLRDRLQLAGLLDATQRRQAEAGNRQAKAEVQDALLQAAVLSGDPRVLFNAQAMTGASQKDVQVAARAALQGRSVEEQARAASTFGVPVDFIEADVQAERQQIMYGDKIDPATVDRAVKRYMGMAPETRALYHKDTYSRFLDELSRKDYRGDNMESAIRLTRTKVNQLSPYTERPTKEISKGVADALDDELERGLWGKIGEWASTVLGPEVRPRPDVNSATRQHIEALVGGAVASSLQSDDPAAQAKAEFQSFKARGEFTHVGRNIILNERPAEARGDARSLANILATDTERAAITTDIVINEAVQKYGFDPDKYVVLRQAGERDKPVTFWIIGTDGQGREAATSFTSDDLKLRLAAANTLIEQSRAATMKQQAEAAAQAAGTVTGSSQAEAMRQLAPKQPLGTGTPDRASVMRALQ